MAVSTSSRVLILLFIFSTLLMISQGHVLRFEKQKDISSQRLLQEFKFDVFKIERRSLITSERIVPGGPDPKHHS
ncbi:CLAVATA3/ESR (CLE)-related protein 6-like [Momordica charantia]|uniref:CLAVATA3/ESR (CLE)-related protein 6-like n=1 Tax=Momordica charantia TaxID=3673 RepID=A0A6J1D7A7_MOMCH|nr:CLAVATA3/ESR (CLE)-related protein 6-like [Momordica charantia]